VTATGYFHISRVSRLLRAVILLALVGLTAVGARPATAADADSSSQGSTSIELTSEDVGNIAELEVIEESEATNLEARRASTAQPAFDIRVGASVYHLPEPDEAAQAPFHKLGAKKETFLSKREYILTSTAKALQMMKYGIGIGSVIGEKLTYITHKVRGKTSERKERRSLSQRAQAVINALLQALDRKLWSSARVIADYNEVHFFIAPGVFAFGGKKTETEAGRVVTGWGGGYSLVLNFGFNREKRGLVFEIVREVEVFRDTILPRVFLAGGAINLGLSFRVREDHALVDVGDRYKPPAAPLTTTDGERMLMISSGPALTVPPPPFGDAVTNTNSLENAPIFRVLLSPNIKGWVRVHSDLARIAKSDARMTVENVENLAGAVRGLAARLRPRGGRSCGALFAR